MSDLDVLRAHRPDPASGVRRSRGGGPEATPTLRAGAAAAAAAAVVVVAVGATGVADQRGADPPPVAPGGTPGTMAIVGPPAYPRLAHISTGYGATWQVREIPAGVDFAGSLPADWQTWPTPDSIPQLRNPRALETSHLDDVLLQRPRSWPQQEPIMIRPSPTPGLIAALAVIAIPA